MVRKQGGMIASCKAGENVVEKCLAEIKRIDPTSLADKLFHITIKTEAYARFYMDGFEYTTDGYGNFTSLCVSVMTTPEIRELKFQKDISECVLCFVY